MRRGNGRWQHRRSASGRRGRRDPRLRGRGSRFAAVPIGVAAQAEPAPGLRIDAFALVLGAWACLAVLAITAVAAARRAASPSREPVRPGVAARTVAAVGAPRSLAAGTRFALDRGRYRRGCPCGRRSSGRRSVSWWSWRCSCSRRASTTLCRRRASTAGHGRHRRRHRGVAKGDDCAPSRRGSRARRSWRRWRRSVAAASRSPGDRWPAGASGVQRDHSTEGGEGQGAGDAVRGRAGAKTLTQADRGVGDRVRIAGPQRSLTSHRRSGGVPERLRSGAARRRRALHGPGPRGWGGQRKAGPRRAARARRHTRRGDHAIAPDHRNGGQAAHSHRTDGDRACASDRRAAGRLAIFVGVVALLAVGFALVTAVRRRRRELAVLKTLGFRATRCERRSRRRRARSPGSAW